ncbi:MAG: HflC protein [Desulfobacteraceae bacterium 4572_130]|nr:MAG: HflC protein [Desulfobacteraceae bacterium 4572_130]
MIKIKGLIVGVIALFVFVLFSSAYIVGETEQVVITQFGKVVGVPKIDPGLKFKIPFIQKASYFPKNLQEWDGDPGQVPTKDKTYIWVDTFARWKIVDPIKYFQTVNNMVSALGRLDDIIDPAMRNFFTSYRLVESVRNTDRPMDTFSSMKEKDKNYSQYKIEMGRSEIIKEMLAQAQPKLRKFGIELIDIKIKRINYVEKVRNAVYERMIAERKQIAEKFRAEGKGEASNIRGDKEKELQLITSQAYKVSQEIKGKADAEATHIYAAAYNLDTNFYAFFKTLEVYKKTFDQTNTLVLSTNSDFMKYFKGIK